MIGVALLNCIETIGDSYSGCELLIVWF